MSARYPGYDVLAKRNTPSWNEKTRRVVDRRMAVPREPRFFSAEEWQTLSALCERILPQPKDSAPVPLPAYVDEKLYTGRGDGYRNAGLPPQREAWRIGLAALDASAKEAGGKRFHELDAVSKDNLIRRMESDELMGDAWQGLSSRLFFKWRVLPDIVAGYYAHPTAWSEIGFGGPASPRGYVRMGFDRRDPWEAPREATETHGAGDTVLEANRSLQRHA
jgi:hypothetical protein